MSEHCVRLFESILQFNERFVASASAAVISESEAAESLPLAGLTCIDSRLNAFVPDALGIPEEKFIWLRNAGNIITSPVSSTMRSLALACAIKGAQEIAIIGHTDCLVRKTSALDLIDRLQALGISRNQLPENLHEYFGLFASERQNVLNAVDFVRRSPLISPKIPVHGLLLDLQTGKLESIVNGYQAFETVAAKFTASPKQAEAAAEWLPSLDASNLAEWTVTQLVSDPAPSSSKIALCPQVSCPLTA